MPEMPDTPKGAIVITEERLKVTEQLIEAAPKPLDYVRVFGEEKYSETPDGQYRVALTDKDGRVDMKKVRLASEMQQEKKRLTAKLQAMLPPSEPVERKQASSRSTFTGGWLPGEPERLRGEA